LILSFQTAREKALQKLRQKKQLPSTKQMVEEIVAGNIATLSQAITLLESNELAKQEKAQEVIAACLPYSGNSIRIGITGVPGVGKSTFIEAFGNYIAVEGTKLAVLAVDPSSQKSRGSILGDKTRMETLTQKDNVFIRPSPSGTSLGGVAQKTRESIILCEAAGFEIIFIETVGVGQSETMVKSMVDFFLLLMLAGAGDELQGIKRGIMEMADAIVITKADGENVAKAKRAAQEYRNALHLLPASDVPNWIPTVTHCSSTENDRLENVKQQIDAFFTSSKKSIYFEENRKQQALNWMHETLNQQILQHFLGNGSVKEKIKVLEEQVLEGKLTPFVAAKEILSSIT
jgi:LAO/AO transport system kinase